MDYLSKDASTTLVTQPTPEFRLIYPPELVEGILRLTTGHPALLQHICFEMVNIANKTGRREMTETDLESVLGMVLDRNNAVMINFWIHFCGDKMKQTVRTIMNGDIPENKADIARLLDYGFIEETDENRYKLRVPLFEMWIGRHGESYYS